MTVERTSWRRLAVCLCSQHKCHRDHASSQLIFMRIKANKTTALETFLDPSIIGLRDLFFHKRQTCISSFPITESSFHIRTRPSDTRPSDFLHISLSIFQLFTFEHSSITCRRFGTQQNSASRQKHGRTSERAFLEAVIYLPRGKGKVQERKRADDHLVVPAEGGNGKHLKRPAQHCTF
jgi:hypothetical protein